MPSMSFFFQFRNKHWWRSIQCLHDYVLSIKHQALNDEAKENISVWTGWKETAWTCWKGFVLSAAALTVRLDAVEVTPAQRHVKQRVTLGERHPAVHWCLHVLSSPEWPSLPVSEALITHRASCFQIATESPSKSTGSSVAEVAKIQQQHALLLRLEGGSQSSRSTCKKFNVLIWRIN